MTQSIYSEAREAFLALMSSFSYPGQIHWLPASITSTTDAFIIAAQTLLDPETTYFTPDTALNTALARTGARAVRPVKAAYHFYTTLDLDVVQTACTGTLLFPDYSATLLIAAQFDTGLTLRLSGPGILNSTEVMVGGIPAAFWKLRQRKTHHPLGWEIYLIDGPRVLGLPRNTRIEMVGAGV